MPAGNPSTQTQRGAVAPGSAPRGRSGPALELPLGIRSGAKPSLTLPLATLGPYLAWLALAAIVVGTAAIAVFAAAGPSILVPRSTATFPGWLAGPLHGLFGHLPNSRDTLELGMSVLVVGMLLPYCLALVTVRTIPIRALWAVVGVLALLLLLTPPLQLTDLFNYLGYARLGALHHLNPYTHVIREAHRDPVYLFASWHNLRSPYGELFTLLTYPLGLLSLPLAYWTLKVATVIAAVGGLWLVGVAAKQLGHDPRPAVAFVGLNPVFLIYAIGGFHVDLLMFVATAAAIALFLKRRDLGAGAALFAAIAIKFTAALVLPFMLVVSRDWSRRLKLVLGVLALAVPLAALSLWLFGSHLPNVGDQNRILTQFSIPNVLGLLYNGQGGTHAVLRDLEVVVVVVTVYQLLRALLQRDRDWLAGAGWATLALIASAAWLMPWYVIWLLPLAALARRASLRLATIALTVFLLLTLGPYTPYVLSQHNVSLLNTSAGKVSTGIEHRLESGPP
jgi:hypothetical protein